MSIDADIAEGEVGTRIIADAGDAESSLAQREEEIWP